jgi:hypothetical protein
MAPTKVLDCQRPQADLAVLAAPVKLKQVVKESGFR